MATFNKFQQFIAEVYNSLHDFDNNQLTVALTNVAPIATNTLLAQLTEISYTGLSSRDLTTTSSSQTGGVYKLIVEDLTLTASGTIPEWQYAAVYDSTAVGNPLVGWYDYGSPVNMTNGSSVILDFDQVGGLLTDQ